MLAAWLSMGLILSQPSSCQEIPEMESESESEELADLLDYLLENPIELSRATAEELMLIPWLSPVQALRLAEYLRGREIRDLWVLVKNGVLDAAALERMLPYIYLEGKAPPPDRLSASTRWQRTWARGAPGSPSPWSNRQRLDYRDSERWRGFVQTQKDVEERDWLDFWSGAAWYRHAPGRFGAVVGDYQLSAGMGLAFGGCGPRIAYPGIMAKPAGRFRESVHASSSEGSALRGGAARWKLGSVTATGAASWRLIDGGLDSSGNLVRIYDDGLHRTPGEMARKNNAEERLGLVSLEWEPFGLGWIGGAGYAVGCEPNLADSLDYRSGASLYGGLAGGAGHISFELAANDRGNGAFSALAGSRRAGCEAAMLVYAYQPGYRAPRFNGYERYGGCDEQGAMIFQKASLPLKSGVSAVFHWYRPWSSRAAVEQGHGGFLLDLKADNDIIKNLEAACRFKLRENERPWQAADAVLLGSERSRTTKAMLDWSAGGGWVISADYAWVRFRTSAGALDRGEMLSAGVGWNGGPGIRLRAQSSLFSTDSYDAAIYQSEPELRGSGSFHPLYGAGRRDALTVRYTHAKRLSAELKLAYTHREYQGETTRQTEFGFQMEVK